MIAPSKAEREPDRAAMRFLHGEHPEGRCGQCAMSWPCDAVVLLDALDEADRRERAVRELHREWEGWCGHCQRYCECIEADDGETRLVGDCLCPPWRDHPCPTIAALDGPSQKLQP